MKNVKIKGYDFVIRNLTGDKVLGCKVVETWCISEEMCIKLMDKYCPLPSNYNLSIAAITEAEDE